MEIRVFMLVVLGCRHWISMEKIFSTSIHAKIINKVTKDIKCVLIWSTSGQWIEHGLRHFSKVSTFYPRKTFSLFRITKGIMSPNCTTLHLWKRWPTYFSACHHLTLRRFKRNYVTIISHLRFFTSTRKNEKQNIRSFLLRLCLDLCPCPMCRRVLLSWEIRIVTTEKWLGLDRKFSKFFFHKFATFEITLLF